MSEAEAIANTSSITYAATLLLLLLHLATLLLPFYAEKLSCMVNRVGIWYL